MSTFDPTTYASFMDGLTGITMSAADAVLQTRQGSTRIKADGSPVTAADEAAEAVIRDGLTRLAPALPIISEEAEHDRSVVPHGAYFLVDPLDGTKEFIAGRDEYTINIAIVADGVPVLGIIAAPAQGLIWRGVAGAGADRLNFSGQKAGTAQPITTRARPTAELVVVVSRSHLDTRTQAFLATLPPTRTLGCGSSVKFCRLAEGAADLYPRLAPTHDWDIAAGHAILVAAGGSVVGADGKAVVYGTPELLIPAFVAWGGPAPAEGTLKAGY